MWILIFSVSSLLWPIGYPSILCPHQYIPSSFPNNHHVHALWPQSIFARQRIAEPKARQYFNICKMNGYTARSYTKFERKVLISGDIAWLLGNEGYVDLRGTIASKNVTKRWKMFQIAFAFWKILYRIEIEGIWNVCGSYTFSPQRLKSSLFGSGCFGNTNLTWHLQKRSTNDIFRRHAIYFSLG